MSRFDRRSFINFRVELLFHQKLLLLLGKKSSDFADLFWSQVYSIKEFCKDRNKE